MMKPELLKEAMQTSKSSYNYEVFQCSNAEEVEKRLTENKDRVGFYWYFIPQEQGCILVVATANLDVIQARTEPRIEKGLKPQSEQETKDLLNYCTYLAPVEEQQQRRIQFEGIDRFITWLYERGYEVAKRVDQEVES